MQRQHVLHSLPARRRPDPAVFVGLGPIGLEVAKLVAQRGDLFRIVGAADPAPHLVGKPLTEVLGSQAPRRKIVADVGALPQAHGIAFHTTTSRLRDVTPSIEALLERGYHVVSSTEELSYPPLREPRLARRLDRAAREAGRCIVGTGINPGFAMDIFPMVLASNMQTLERVTVQREVNASLRREPLQRKVGSGMTAEEFEALAEKSKIGHVGLVESTAHLAGALGWHLDRVHELLEPRVARRRIRTQYFDVPAGRVCGIHHRAEGYAAGKLRVVLDLIMELEAPNPRDEVQLEGHPPITCVVPGGFHGDRTTASQLLSAATRLEAMPPGLHLASDLPAPSWAARRVRMQLA